MKRLILFFAAGVLLVGALHAEYLRVHFIDVGQGSAVLLETPDARVLVDAGQYADAYEYLTKIGVETLDLAIATHAHADHIGGFIPILRNLRVGTIWYNGQTHTTRTFERFIDAMLESDAAYHEPSRGESVRFGRLVVTVLHPEGSAAEYEGHLHDKNIVVRARFGEFSVLLTGDAEIEAEREMISVGVALASTVLKLGHHGSSTSSSPEFLKAVNPEVAVYQAGSDNRYGHPHGVVMRRIEALRGVDLYGTAGHGTIVIETDGLTFTIETEW
ncbi:MAG: MBL fold metallo-hydrolase [Spirochaetaceae bacterium]|nr:MAG: MBL fold metallo-hydrolase [Spirochaetaceae bacterium]